MLVASDALVAGEMRVVRLESALGPCVQGLHEKREKVPHPGLQHVLHVRPGRRVRGTLYTISIYLYTKLEGVFGDFAFARLRAI